MLLAIRDRTRGWIAYLIVALLVIPFALFGLYNYVSDGSGAQTVANVDGVEITRPQLDQAFQRRQADLREMLGERFDPGLFDGDQLRRETLQQLIDRQLLLNYAQQQGLRVSDADVAQTVRSQSFFQVDGEFSVERYRQVLQQNQLTPERYEANIRQDLAVGFLRRAVESSTYTSDRALDRLLALQGQRRELGWVSVAVDDYRDAVAVNESALEQWYEANAAQFEQPEQVKLRYIVLDPADIAERIAVDAAAIEQRYAERQAALEQSANRRVRHILIEVPDSADQAANAEARETLEAARQQIQDGAAFADLAAELSDDPGSAAQGGDLGRIQREDVVPAFAEAAWALAPGELSQPVRTAFGWHLIEVTAIEAGDLAPLEALRDTLRDEIALARAEREVFELANTLDTLAFENPQTLTPAAEALGVEVMQSDWLSAGSNSANPDVLNDPTLRRAAFSEALRNQRENSELLELESGRYAVIRVSDYQPAAVAALAEVRDTVREGLIREQASASARSDAESLAQALRDGVSLRDAAANVAGARVNEPRWSGRNERELPAGVREVGFRLPTQESAMPAAQVARLPDGWAAVSVFGVENGDPQAVEAQARTQLRRSMNQMDGQAGFQAVLAALRAQADIRVMERNF